MQGGIIARGGGLIAFLTFAFAAYCQVHGAITAAPVPPSLSVRWGAAAGVPAGLLVWLLYERRAELIGFVSRGAVSSFLFAGLVVIAVALGGAAVHLVASTHVPRDVAAALGEAAFRRMPLALALAALALAMLHLARRARVGVAAAAAPVDGASDWIALPGKPELLLRSTDIALIRSAGNYCEVHVSGAVHLVRCPLKTMAKTLSARGFIRVHRTLIVNIASVEAVTLGRSEADRAIRLRCGTRLPLGSRFRDAVAEALALRSGASPPRA